MYRSISKISRPLLQVKYVQARDAGVYECQVGTEPKMSHFVQLNVVVPKIEIAGEADLFVKAGSTVSLRCVITQALEEPAYIFWYRNDERVLNYDRRLLEIRMERVAPDTTVRIISVIIVHNIPVSLSHVNITLALLRPIYIQQSRRRNRLKLKKNMVSTLV